MHIKALALHNFRNYKELLYTPSEGINLIYGDNAQGKTNLLEAMFLCAFGRSQRTVHDDELIMHGSDNAMVKMRMSSEQNGEHTVSICLNRGKLIEIDGVRIRRLADLMGVLKAVMFSPESMQLVKGAPSERRRFMDMCISQLSRSYFYRLQQYMSALRQRNALLKNTNATENREYVRMWDEQLAASGAYIMAARERFLDMLTPVAYAIHDKLSQGKDEFELQYAPSVKSDSGKQLKEQIAERLAACFSEDVKRGSTSVGVHKDDILMKTNGLDSRAFASQGQQRTAALSLKLSEIEFMRNVSGEYPVVFLDDVFSELDESRCLSLLECVKDCQCIFTSAQSVNSLYNSAMQTVRCVNGTLLTDNK